MRMIWGAALAACMASATPAAGGSPTSTPALDDRDRAAIEAMENRMAPLPGPNRSRTPGTLAARMAEIHVPAVSVAFIEDGRVKWARAYGETQAGSGHAATPATTFQAGSMSKPLAAAAALRLVDQGRLALDQDVNERLRAWRVPLSASASGNQPGPTLRQLLSHTGGLSVSGYAGYGRGQTTPTLVQSLSGAKPATSPALRAFAAPGAQIAYSGGGYSVAQLLMTEAKGESFGPLMGRLVLRPAGMRESSFEQPPPATVARNAAAPHDENGRPLADGAHVYPEQAAAGLWTTAADYARFVVALQNAWAGRPGALLRPATARTMMTPVLEEYGLGLFVRDRGGRTVISHGGANEGFESSFVAFVDGSRQGLVVLTNAQGGGALAAAIQRTIARVYGWDDASGPPLPRAPD